MQTSKRHIKALGAATALMLGLLSACGDDAESDAESTDSEITVATLGITGTQTLELAEQKGWFDDVGTPVKITSGGASPADVIGVIQGGKADIGYVATVPLLMAVSKGLELQVVAPSDGFPTNAEDDPAKWDATAIVATSGISTPADLSGKTIAVPALGAQLQLAAAASIESYGGDASDVKWLQLDLPSMNTALKSGKVDAIVTVDPFVALAVEDGGVVLDYPSLSAFGGGTTQGVWVAKADWVKDNPDAVKQFREVMLKANNYGVEHLEEILKVASDNTDTPIETLRAGAVPYWSPTFDRNDLEVAAKLLLDAGALTSVPDFGPILGE